MTITSSGPNLLTGYCFEEFDLLHRGSHTVPCLLRRVVVAGEPPVSILNFRNKIVILFVPIQYFIFRF